jgi:protein-tyrosine phosphatase
VAAAGPTAAAVAVAGLPNLRDLGGWPVRDGRVVARGRVYRSQHLGGLDAEATTSLQRLGLRSVYDLRTAAEVQALPDRLPPGATWFAADVLADAPTLGPARLLELLREPVRANDVLGQGRAEAMFERSFRDFVTLPGACRGYRALFTGLARPERRPALFHCTAGKDRAGWAAAALLKLLGVADDDVMDDFLRSTDRVLAAFARQVQAFVDAGGDREVVLAVAGARPAYLQAALDAVRDRHGSIERYFADALGIDADAQRALQDALLVTAPAAA